MPDFLFEQNTPVLPTDTQLNQRAGTFLFEQPAVEPTAPQVEAIQESPDSAAKIHDLSRRTGIGQQEVRENQKQIEAQVKAEDIARETKDTPVVNNWVAIPENTALAQDDVENLSTFERLSRQWRVGRLEVELGRLGSQLRNTAQDPRVAQQIIDLQTELAKIGEDTQGGFIGWLGASAKVLGQQVEILSTPEAAMRIGGAGALAAGSAAALSGPGAVVTAPVAAAAGMASGALGHIAYESYIIEGGNSYLELLTEGVEKDTAGVLSHSVGIVNAALEMAGVAVIAKPLTSAGKLLFKQGLKQAIKRPAVITAANQFVKMYGAGVAAEVTTEVFQEVVNITALEIGKVLTDTDLEAMSQSEIEERLEAVAIETFKAMSVLALPGPSANFASQITTGKRSTDNADLLERMHQILQDSKLRERAPDKLAEVSGQVMEQSGITKIFVSGPAMSEFIAAQPNPEEYAAQIGITPDQLDNAISFDTDIPIDPTKFAQHVLMSPDYPIIAGHIRDNEDGFTREEAKEYATSGLKADIEAAISGEFTPLAPQEPDVDIATQEMGLQQLFRTADEAGMTPGDYQEYLVSLQQAAERANIEQQDKVLRQQQRELTAQWKAELEIEKDRIRSTLSEEPVYQALNAIGSVRLDRTQVEEAVKRAGFNLEDLPKQERGRAIFAPITEAGLDIDQHAEIHGFNTGQEFIEAVLTSTPFEQAVTERASITMLEKHGDIRQQQQAVREARASLHNDTQAKVLEMEVNALRDAKREKRVSLTLVRRAVKHELSKLPIKNISASKFMTAEKRLAREARKALRSGDRQLAANLKFKQLLNFEMFRLAEKTQTKIAKQRQYMQKFLRNRKSNAAMPVDYLQAIREVLTNVNFSDRGDPRSVISLNKLASSPITPIDIPSQFKMGDVQVNYKDLRLNEFTELHDTVKTIEHEGKTLNKFRNKRDKKEVDLIATFVSDNIRKNIKADNKNVTERRGNWARWKRAGTAFKASLMNMDTVVREADGFVDLGVVYQNTKGRIDKALTQGYMTGQIGYLRRQQKEAKRISAIFDKHFKLSEKKKMNDSVKVEGVNRDLSHHTVLSVLLNSGNTDNLQAMVNSQTFSAEEIQAIHNHASKRDWEFAQDVWDYLDEFWPEVSKTVERRTNTSPLKVDPTPIINEHGTFRGGYYPIRYDKHQSLADTFDADNIDALVQQARYGAFAQSHTANGHTKSRKNPGNARVLMDLFVINSHVDNVILDLEVGDAVHDFYKVWYHKDVRKAFADQGAQHFWEYGDVWLRDVIAQEVGATDGLSYALRWLRTGFTISKLGWNLGVVAVQPVGLVQSSVMVGRKHMWRGLRAFMSAPKFGENSVFKFMEEKSGFMATRAINWNRDIVDAQKQVAAHFLDRITPGKTADLVRSSLFWGITKTQRITDAITWMAAYSKGVQMFDTEADVITYADRIVSRTQASGIFSERTGFERGSVSKNTRQSELIRVWTPIISYFAAKYNIAYEKTKKTSFKNPGQVVAWAWDMSLLFIIETAIANLIVNRGPDEEEDEGWGKWLFEGTISTVAAGIPFIREGVSEARGFPGGGVIGTIAKYIGSVWKSATADEVTVALIKNTNNLLGIFFHYPAAQANKMITAQQRVNEGEEVGPAEWIFGPKPKK